MRARLTTTILKNKTSVSIEKETMERLKQLGKKGDSYDEIINRLIDEHGHKEKTKK